MYDAIDGQLMLQFHTPLIVTNVLVKIAFFPF